MDAYPKLEPEAYTDSAKHRPAVVGMIACYAADMWRYYCGRTPTPEEVEKLRVALDKGLPEK